MGPIASYLPPPGSAAITYGLFGVSTQAVGGTANTITELVTPTASPDQNGDPPSPGKRKFVLTFTAIGGQSYLTKLVEYDYDWNWPGWSTTPTLAVTRAYAPGLPVAVFGTAGTQLRASCTETDTVPQQGTTTSNWSLFLAAVASRGITVPAGTYTCQGYTVALSAERLAPGTVSALGGALVHAADTLRFPLVQATVWMASGKGIIAVDAGNTAAASVTSHLAALLPHLFQATKIG
jgi:hypothetical protein